MAERGGTALSNRAKWYGAVNVANGISKGLNTAGLATNTALANAQTARSIEKQLQFQARQQQAQMAFNSAEAQKNRDWQEQMSNTAYQRAVADLKRAGLNPILRASNLSGRTTPGGSSASASAMSGRSYNAEIEPYNWIGALITSAMEIMLNKINSNGNDRSTNSTYKTNGKYGGYYEK